MADQIDYDLLAMFDDISLLSHVEVRSHDEIMSMNLFEEEPRPQPTVREEITESQQSVPVEEGTRNDRKEDDGVFAAPKIYNCMYCCKRFYRQSAVRRHQVNHAKQQLQCPWCKKRSYNVHILARHLEYFHLYSKHKHVLIQA